MLVNTKVHEAMVSRQGRGVRPNGFSDSIRAGLAVSTSSTSRLLAASMPSQSCATSTVTENSG
jgi:hypothetical protein